MSPIQTKRWERTRKVISLRDVSSLAIDYHGELSEEQLEQIEELAQTFYDLLIDISGLIALVQMGPESNMDRLPR